MLIATLALAGSLAATPAVVDKPDVNEVSAAAIPGANEADCSHADCRPGGNRTFLHYDSQHGVEFVVPRSPYLGNDGSIVIYPGETLLFDFPQATANSPGRPRFLRTEDGEVKSNDPAAAGARATLRVSYRQEPLAPGQFGMALDVKHLLPATLKFDTTISHFMTDRIVQAKSATCALAPNRTGGETWPELVGPLVLSDLRFGEQPGGNTGIAASSRPAWCGD